MGISGSCGAVVAGFAMVGLATAAAAEVTTLGSATIEPAVGTSVVPNVLSQTNILVSVISPNQAVASVSVPGSLGGVGNGGGADVNLPTVVTPLGGGGAPGIPNGVAMSVSTPGAGLGPTGAGDDNGNVLVVIQYN